MDMVCSAILKLRRDNDYNYQKIENTFIPFNGEVCLIDTARNGLRAKIGDGTHTLSELPFTDQNTAANIIVCGYFKDNGFYYESTYENIIEASFNKIYIDVSGNKIYFYNGNEYIVINEDLPVASATSAGIVKLYGVTGQNTDGSMTQKAITDELNTKIEASCNDSEELLILSTL